MLAWQHKAAHQHTPLLSAAADATKLTAAPACFGGVQCQLVEAGRRVGGAASTDSGCQQAFTHACTYSHRPVLDCGPVLRLAKVYFIEAGCVKVRTKMGEQAVMTEGAT